MKIFISCYAIDWTNLYKSDAIIKSIEQNYAIQDIKISSIIKTKQFFHS